jgi:hypothetical protein
MKKILPLFTAVLLFATVSNAAIIEVPTDHATIQEAINASLSGDTIVVLPGSYLENINFRGKNVVLTSLYYLAADTSYITSTIIDGSSPVNPDTASCVIFSSGEDSTAVLQGFTLTGGAGTKWTDIHGAGVFREGGGILVELSSPTIRHNVIRENECTDLTGVTSTGGGGIRIGDGNPYVIANSIIFNFGRYGAGVVLNYTGCHLENNVIAHNYGGLEYLGGSGIWIYGNKAGKHKVIINNTIAYNSAQLATGTGGISVWSAANVQITNCIVYGNTPALQIKVSSASPNVTYCNVAGGYTGTGNIDVDPLFDMESFLLDEASPCVDTGDIDAIYNDLEDPANPGLALFPSRGGLRNDIGAYGGPYASVIPYTPTFTGIINPPATNEQDFIYPNPTRGKFTVAGSGELEIRDLGGKVVYSSEVNHSVIDISAMPEGTYVVRLTDGKKVSSAKLILLR